MEFLAIDMVLTGVGPVSSAITGFMVNFRHLFYGLTYPRSAIRRGLPSAYATYALTDEVYAITSTLCDRPSGPRLMTISVVCQIAWVASGIVGALAGAVIPAGVEGFDFAVTALFAVLAFEAFQSSRDLSAPLIAGGLALAAAMSNYGLPDGVSLGMVAAVLIPVGIVTVLLRALPFSMLRVLKGSPFIDFLAVLMPVGVMTVLVVYTLVGHAGSPAHLASALVALVATLLLHCWKRRADVPIFVGTALYMLLVNVVF